MTNNTASDIISTYDIDKEQKMKKFFSLFVLLLAILCVFTACKADNDATPQKDVISVSNGYLVVNGVKTEHKVYTEPTVSAVDGYVAINGVKTEHKIYTEPTVSVVDGYVAINGVKTEYELELTCDHNWQTVTTPPTCKEDGFDVMTCSYCNKTVRTNIVAATSHKFTSYMTDNEYHWQKCSICGDIENKSLHDLDNEGVCIGCQLPLTSTPGVIYTTSPDGTYAIVASYNGNAKNVKIAEEYNGLPVLEIYNEAFKKNKTITTVVIPDSVTSIGDEAFYLCSSLSSVVIPDSVTSIGEYAFEDCSSLSSVVIPDSVTSIGDFAFYGCDNLKDVYYTGSKSDWVKIYIGTNNYCLTNATIHYNYVFEK